MATRRRAPKAKAGAAGRGWGPGWPTDRSADQQKVVVGDVTVFMHRGVAELTGRLMVETERRGYNLQGGWCWGYAYRPVRGTRTASNHSWGLAIDNNAPRNPMTSGRLVTDIPRAIVDLWESYGYEWGGDWSGRKDAMHFEFKGTPAQAMRHLERARRELGKEAARPVDQPAEPAWTPPTRPVLIIGQHARAVEVCKWEIGVISGYAFPQANDPFGRPPHDPASYDLYLAQAIVNLGAVLHQTWDGRSVSAIQWAWIDGLYRRKAGEEPVPI